MMSSNNNIKPKGRAFDEAQCEAIMSCVLEYEKYLSTVQEQAQFRRHMKAAADKARAMYKESEGE